ncbi:MULTISPECIES: TonB-dependent receptor [Methylococcus]|uniref:TonB-dependent receptor n=1 Tax=Methylococcus capsulatus TaxID=414 RepID=A0ABZ2F8Y9_METCP|nr:MULTISPECIES: TonB-dependent receptor [Methylococcus]MDF9393588.1 TonB-dependent receptor [Methylococcus capsulatus]
MFKRSSLSFYFIALVAPLHAAEVSEPAGKPVGNEMSPPAVDAEPASVELEPVVVSSPLEEKVSDMARPVTVLTDKELRTKIGTTIGETLKQEAGVTSGSFGPGVGIPVIRGQTGPRVQVMTNSIGTGDVSQISPDHANAVEPVLADRVEILRGPATLLYGSGAIGGIVNVLDNRIPSLVPDKLMTATGEQRFNSVSGQTTTNLKVEGGQDLVSYHLDGFYRESNNLHIGGPAIAETQARQTDLALQGSPIQNSYGVIPNTENRAKGGSAGFSLVGEPGFAGVSINYLGNNYGIPPDGSPGAGDTRINLKESRYDFKSELNAPVDFVEIVRMRFGHINYTHTELNDGVAAARFNKTTNEGRLEVAHQPIGIVKGVVGVQMSSADFEAIEIGSPDALVPKSQLGSYGVFAVESFELGAGVYELGLRGESDSIDPQGGPNRSYAPISASASGQWKLDDEHAVSFAVTRSQRAPQVQELFTDGVHDATHSYELGDPNLTEETSYNFDWGYRYRGRGISAELNVFQNFVNDYIYQQITDEVFNEDSEQFEKACTSPGACFPVVQTTQAGAYFLGYEGNVKFSLMENRYGVLDLTLFSDFTRGQFVNGGNVPRMPPLRYGLQLDYAYDEHWSGNLRLTRGEKQIYAGQNDAMTNGYVLLNLGVQYEVKAFKDADVLVFAQGNNLLNDNIRNSTSYLRYFAPEAGRGAELGIRITY